MQRPLQISFRGLEHSDAVERRVRDKVAELERFSAELIGCHVTIEAVQHRHHQENLYVVHIDIRLPDHEIVVGRERRRDHAHEDVYVAIRDSFDAAVRMLEDYVRRRRGDVKTHEPITQGRIVRLEHNQGFGVAETTEGGEVYFHRNSVVKSSFDGLQIGDDVRITIAEGEGEKGPQASTIIPMRGHHA